MLGAPGANPRRGVVESGPQPVASSHHQALVVIQGKDQTSKQKQHPSATSSIKVGNAGFKEHEMTSGYHKTWLRLTALVCTVVLVPGEIPLIAQEQQSPPA